MVIVQILIVIIEGELEIKVSLIYCIKVLEYSYFHKNWNKILKSLGRDIRIFELDCKSSKMSYFGNLVSMKN